MIGGLTRRMAGEKVRTLTAILMVVVRIPMTMEAEVVGEARRVGVLVQSRQPLEVVQLPCPNLCREPSYRLVACCLCRNHSRKNSAEIEYWHSDSGSQGGEKEERGM